MLELVGLPRAPSPSVFVWLVLGVVATYAHSGELRACSEVLCSVVERAELPVGGSTGLLALAEAASDSAATLEAELVLDVRLLHALEAPLCARATFKRTQHTAR